MVICECQFSPAPVAETDQSVIFYNVFYSCVSNKIQWGTLGNACKYLLIIILQMIYLCTVFVHAAWMTLILYINRTIHLPCAYIQSLLYEATKMPRPVLLANLTQSVHQSPNFTFISVMHIGRQRKMFSFRGALYNLTFSACMCLWCHIELWQPIRHTLNSSCMHTYRSTISLLVGMVEGALFAQDNTSVPSQ